MVHGLSDQYGDKMKFTIKPAKDHKEQIAKYFGEDKRHGMIILNDKGETMWSEGGHKQKRETIVAEVQKVLK